MHLNVQSLLPKIDIMVTELLPYDIVVLTETWLKPHIHDDQLTLPGFSQIIRNDRTDRPGGGVAIYVKSTISSTLRNDLLINGLVNQCSNIL